MNFYMKKNKENSPLAFVPNSEWSSKSRFDREPSRLEDDPEMFLVNLH